jgi:uncharacterized protein YprB with RNaseH-like and TPR domain
MLTESFIFLPQIGERRERRLWEQGVRSWRDYEAASVDAVRGVGEGTKRRHEELLDEARSALRTDPSFFGEELPSGETWRAYGDLRDEALFLDIETTGLSRWATVTVVGLHGPRGTRCLVKGEDLTRKRVEKTLEEASLLVTFNGARFDLPMLEGMGVEVPDTPHLDLMYPLDRLGLDGGLKAIEDELGVGRGDEVDDLGGADAVRLWRQWERRGDRSARDRLVRYNRADVENMVPVAEHAYEGLREQTLEPVTAD